MDDAAVDQLARQLGRSLDRRRAGGLIAGVLGTVAALRGAPVTGAGLHEVSPAGKPTRKQKKECKETAEGCRRTVPVQCSGVTQEPDREERCKKALRKCCNLIEECKNKKKVLRCLKRVPFPTHSAP